MLNGSPLGHNAAERSLPLRDAFAVLFFVSVGMLFNPAVLLGMRMAPDMYDLAQQIGEACRHATVAAALLAH